MLALMRRAVFMNSSAGGMNMTSETEMMRVKNIWKAVLAPDARYACDLECVSIWVLNGLVSRSKVSDLIYLAMRAD